MSNEIKIMYVDDEIMNLQLFDLIFSKKYEVITAISGIAALDLLEDNLDTIIVISDMKMPIMNGLEFIHKAKEKHPDIKYYILTGYDITVEIQEALNTKLIMRYFRKPFDINEIDIAIRTAVNI